MDKKEWAIITSGHDGLITTIKLTDWFDWEWDDFDVLKDSKTENIIWFSSEKEAKEFAIETFEEDKLNPKLFEQEEPFYFG